MRDSKPWLINAKAVLDDSEFCHWKFQGKGQSRIAMVNESELCHSKFEGKG